MNLLKYFFENPGKEYHVRELAKFVKKSPTTVSKYLKNYEKEGILLSKKKFNHLFFKANQMSLNFKNNKLFFNVDLISNSGLVEYLKDYYDSEAIVLFGSFAKAENISKSDIDLFIVTSSKKEVNLRKYEKKLGHKIQLFLHSKKEIKKLNKDLLNNFVNGFKLDGYLEVF